MHIRSKQSRNNKIKTYIMPNHVNFLRCMDKQPVCDRNFPATIVKWGKKCGGLLWLCIQTERVILIAHIAFSEINIADLFWKHLLESMSSPFCGLLQCCLKKYASKQNSTGQDPTFTLVQVADVPGGARLVNDYMLWDLQWLASIWP